MEKIQPSKQIQQIEIDIVDFQKSLYSSFDGVMDEVLSMQNYFQTFFQRMWRWFINLGHSGR